MDSGLAPPVQIGSRLVATAHRGMTTFAFAPYDCGLPRIIASDSEAIQF